MGNTFVRALAALFVLIVTSVQSFADDVGVTEQGQSFGDFTVTPDVSDRGMAATRNRSRSLLPLSGGWNLICLSTTILPEPPKESCRLTAIWVSAGAWAVFHTSSGLREAILGVDWRPGRVDLWFCSR